MKKYLKNVNGWRVFAWVLGVYFTIAAYSNGFWPAVNTAIFYAVLINIGGFIVERDAEIAKQNENPDVQ